MNWRIGEELKTRVENLATEESDPIAGEAHQAVDLPNEIPKRRKDRPNGTALCLSGGGYRAALFHLGTMRCLHDMGILQTVQTVSSVSGGSIIAAFLAKKLIEDDISDGLRFTDWERQVSSSFRSFVQNDLRTVPVFAHVLWNWIAPKWRARHLERMYRKKLTSISRGGSVTPLMLGELPEKPNFVFCATDLTFGVNWIYTRERVGDYQVGYQSSITWPLANAVTASSCFPPIFGPVILNLVSNDFKKGNYKKEDRAALLAGLQLTDGGVYDNFGLEPVDNDHKTIIVSDGGSPFGYVVTGGPLKRLMRYTTVIMRQTAALRKRSFFTGITNEWHSGMYLGIDAETKVDTRADFGGYSPVALRFITKIRTDLDRFSDAEARILENHGYCVAHDRILAKGKDLILNPGYEPRLPHPGFVTDEIVETALRTSHRRFSLARIFGRS